MEHSPAEVPNHAEHAETEADEPRLELVPDPVDDAEEADDEDEADDEKPAAAKASVPVPTQDPLKLYVRQIGDGP